MRNKLLLTTFAGAGLAAAAIAAGPGGPGWHGGPGSRGHDQRGGSPMRHHADADGDGRVTAAEWDALFAKLDADGDGVLAGDELPGRGHHGPPPAGMIVGFFAAGADADRDGKVTAAELAARFAALDTDGDGALSASELHARRPMRAPEGLRDELPPFLAEHDSDSDGKLSLAEIEALFAAADEDGDGVLSGDELFVPRFHRHHR